MKVNEVKTTAASKEHFDEIASTVLIKHGFSVEASKAIGEMEMEMFRLYRRMMRGDFRELVISRLNIDMEEAQFHGMTAVARVTFGLGDYSPRAASIGDVAAELKIDPSRASRIVADLVANDLLRREVAQDDARKSIIVLTPKALDILKRFRVAKLDILGDMLSDWSSDEIKTFARLLAKYTDASQRQAENRDKSASD